MHEPKFKFISLEPSETTLKLGPVFSLKVLCLMLINLNYLFNSSSSEFKLKFKYLFITPENWERKQWMWINKSRQSVAKQFKEANIMKFLNLFDNKQNNFESI